MSMLRLLCLLLAASLGVLCSECLCRSTAFRDVAGRVFGRGGLVAITNAKGAYERDLETEAFTGPEFVARENLRRLARDEPADSVLLDRELSLPRAQFGDEQVFLREAHSNGFSIHSLRDRIADHLRSLQWFEKQVITTVKAVTEQECRDFYDAHPRAFAQPKRFRASHLFLAAPADTPSEVVESKQEMIDTLAERLGAGETLAQLAAETSEDEATKLRGGDLGFFSKARMPPDFFAEVEKLAVGQRSKPFRSHLGFHIVEVTEIRPARVLGFDEAKGDISLALANERRALIAKRLTDMLTIATYARSD
jgi:hypothetical protein